MPKPDDPLDESRFDESARIVPTTLAVQEHLGCRHPNANRWLAQADITDIDMSNCIIPQAISMAGVGVLCLVTSDSGCETLLRANELH
jgi:hypothetical protein